MIKAILCDLDGVIYSGGQLIPGIKRGIQAIREKNLPLRFISNTSTKNLSEIREQLIGFGFDVDQNELITPVSLAYDFLKANNQTALPIVRDSLKPFFKVVSNHNHPDWILIGDIGQKWSNKLLNELLTYLEKGAEILAMHKNAYALFEGKKVLDIGSFIAALEYAANKKATVIGKPSLEFFRLAIAGFDVESVQQILMIGDDPIADITGAQRAGLTTMFVESGKSSIEDLEGYKIKPDFIFKSLADIISII
ncbi:MAG: HAD superfamily hydrolase (TIGR01458 family) [Cyclobacteriaceae bacterium]|jgi:HAD superfamily hydrolase (TIGR01458 family)